jgi:hypothetical protein
MITLTMITLTMITLTMMTLTMITITVITLTMITLTLIILIIFTNTDGNPLLVSVFTLKRSQWMFCILVQGPGQDISVVAVTSLLHRDTGRVRVVVGLR